MKALSLWEPWASLTVEVNPDTGLPYKRIETRSWGTAYRGELAIVSTVKPPEVGLEVGVWTVTRGADGYFMRPCPPWDAAAEGRFVPLTAGVVVSTCTLADVVPITGENLEGHLDFVCPDIGGGLTLYRFGNGGMFPATVEDDITDQLPYGDYTPGRFAWLLEGLTPLDPPVPAKGKQGLWEWNP